MRTCFSLRKIMNWNWVVDGPVYFTHFIIHIQYSSYTRFGTCEVQRLNRALNNVSERSFFSLRKQPTFREATTGFLPKWHLRDERRNSAMMTCHYPRLGIAFDWLKRISFATQLKRIILPRSDKWRWWHVISNEYGISGIDHQTSFRGRNREMLAIFSG